MPMAYPIAAVEHYSTAAPCSGSRMQNYPRGVTGFNRHSSTITEPPLQLYVVAGSSERQKSRLTLSGSRFVDPSTVMPLSLIAFSRRAPDTGSSAPPATFLPDMY